MILVVEDSATQRALLLRSLRGAGWADARGVATAAEAFEALGLAGDGGFPDVDLLLLDRNLPDLDGTEVAMRVRAHPVFRDLPILVVTADARPETLQLAFAAGANDYLVKPPDDLELTARVRNALQLKRETDRRKARELELLEATRRLERANDALQARESELVRVTERLHEMNRALEALSGQDALTGLGNRRAFDRSLDEEWRRALRAGAPLAVALLDVDAFKAYNDRFGHPAGDRCLEVIGSALSATLRRAGDVVARYGGEEFAAIMPGVDLERALRAAARLRAAVRAEGIEHPDGPAGIVTASAGVASIVPRPDLGPADLVAAADRALYAAKRAGRDRAAAARKVVPAADAQRPAAGPPLAAPTKGSAQG